MSALAATLLALAAAATAGFLLYRRWLVYARAEYIRNFTMPLGLYTKLMKKQPSLTLKDCQLVGHALRHFFLAYLKSGCRVVSMPSQVADDLWHEFILYTRQYNQFCRRAFGRFLHHAPAAVLGKGRQSDEGLKRVWFFACREDHISPNKPGRLPLLFALDAKLNIPDGFQYKLDCLAFRKKVGAPETGAAIYCATDIQSSGGGSIAGCSGSGTGWFSGGDSSSDGGAHGGCNSGCSGGCSGGCGGGD